MPDTGSARERKSRPKPMDPILVCYKITINEPCTFNADVKDIDRHQRMESHKIANKRKKSTNAASLCDRRKGPKFLERINIIVFIQQNTKYRRRFIFDHFGKKKAMKRVRERDGQGEEMEQKVRRNSHTFRTYVCIHVWNAPVVMQTMM